jgi:glucosamine-6-phosphate deaminase
MKSANIVCSVPDRRKAQAVTNTIAGPVTPMVPASILRQHPAVTLYLDAKSAASS